MTTPAPKTPVGAFHRALVEALESVAAPDQVRSVLRHALLAAGLESVPDDAIAFRAFVDGALSASAAHTLGEGAAEMIAEQLSQVLRFVAPAAPRRATGTDDADADEPSGERAVGPLTAPQLFPPRTTAYESGTRRKGTVAADVLVVSLDPRLVAEVAAQLEGRSRVVAVTSPGELTSALRSTRGPVAVLLDMGVPAIDVPTFAKLSPTLPTGTHVVLWGTNERQKRRLAELYPQVEAWVASGAVDSPEALLAIPGTR